MLRAGQWSVKVAAIIAAVAPVVLVPLPSRDHTSKLRMATLRPLQSPVQDEITTTAGAATAATSLTAHYRDPDSDEDMTVARCRLSPPSA